MIRPRININGTSPEALIEPRLAAHRLLASAIESLKDACPNGRDYPGDFEQCAEDRVQHYARIGALRALMDELLEESLVIQRQSD